MALRAHPPPALREPLGVLGADVLHGLVQHVLAEQLLHDAVRQARERLVAVRARVPSRPAQLLRQPARACGWRPSRTANTRNDITPLPCSPL